MSTTTPPKPENATQRPCQGSNRRAHRLAIGTLMCPTCGQQAIKESNTMPEHNQRENQ